MRTFLPRLLALCLALMVQAVSATAAAPILFDRSPYAALQSGAIESGSVQLFRAVLDGKLIQSPDWQVLATGYGAETFSRQKKVLVLRAAFVASQPAAFFQSAEFLTASRLESLTGARIKDSFGGGRGASLSGSKVSASLLIPLQFSFIDSSMEMGFQMEIEHSAWASLDPSADLGLRQMAGEFSAHFGGASPQSITQTRLSEFSHFFESAGGMFQYIPLSPNKTLIVFSQASIIKPAAWTKLQMATLGGGEKALGDFVIKQIRGMAAAAKSLR